MQVVDYIITVLFLGGLTIALWTMEVPYIMAAASVVATYVLGYLDAWEVYAE